MPITWRRNGEKKVHVFTSRPGYTRLLYIFEVPLGTSDSQVTAEIARRDPMGVRLASR